MNATPPSITTEPAVDSSTPWPAGATSRVVDLDGPVHYLEFDTPDQYRRPGLPVVVCLHGLGGSALNFGLLGPLLSTRARVLAVDLRAHGRTPPLPSAGRPQHPPGAVADNLRLLSRFLGQQVGQPVVMVGHSLGGVLALLHTMAEPATVEHLVLLAPPASSPTSRARDLRLAARLGLLRAPGVERIVARQGSSLTPEQLVARQLDEATPHRARVPADALAASAAEVRWRRSQPEDALAQKVQWQAILDTIHILARPREWRARIAGVTAPTLWLQGVDDRRVSLDDARALALTRPDWRFAARPGVGHLPHLEDAEWTASQITRWALSPTRAGTLTDVGPPTRRRPHRTRGR